MKNPSPLPWGEGGERSEPGEGSLPSFLEHERMHPLDWAKQDQADGFSGRNKGKRMTSRMERESVSNMVRRSMPMPSPPVGGMP